MVLQQTDSYNSRRLCFTFRSVTFVFAVLYVYILLTNFSIQIINSLFLIVLLAYAIFAKIEYSIALVPFMGMYFGYSYLGFENVLNLANTQFVSIYVAIIVIRSIPLLMNLLINDKKVLLRLCLLLILPVFLLIQKQYLSVGRCLVAELFAVVCGYLFRNRKDVLKWFTILLIVSLMSTYLYNIIYIQILHLDAAISHLTLGRYVGIRDANNFALESNIALLLIEVAKPFKKEKNKRVVVAILTIGILATVSMSGIASMCLIHWFRYTQLSSINNKKNKINIVLLIIPGIIVVGGILLGLSHFIDLGGIGTILSRIETVFQQLMAGDFSTATSSRTYLWGRYWSTWQGLTGYEQMIGSYQTYARMITSQLGSHNTYIDFLMTYGYVGSTALLGAILLNYRTTDDKALQYIKYVYLINIFFRSVDPMSGLLFLYMLL